MRTPDGVPGAGASQARPGAARAGAPRRRRATGPAPSPCAAEAARHRAGAIALRGGRGPGRLRRLATSDDSPDAQELVDALAERLGRGVSVEDRRWRLLAYSAQDEAADPVRQASILRRRADPDVAAWLDALGLERAAGPVDVPANPALGMAARTCAPLRDEQGVLLGFAWVLGAADHGLLAEAAGPLGAALGRRRRAEDARRAARVERLAAALRGDAAAGEALAAELRWPAEVRVALAADEPAARTGCVAAPRTSLGDVVRHHDEQRRPGGWVVVGGAIAEDRPRSSPVPAGALARGLREAEVAEAAHRAGAPAAFDELGGWAPVTELWLAAGRPAYEGPLRALDGRDDLEQALEGLLDAGGDATAAAAALHLHRATLYRRIERVEQLTGLDLHRGDDRLTAHLGLRLRRLARG